MKKKGHKCKDCNRYIVPPQQYDPITIRLCVCDEAPLNESLVQKATIRPAQIAPEIADRIQRLVQQDDARKEFIPAHVPIYFSVVKKPVEPILARIAHYFAV